MPHNCKNIRCIMGWVHIDIDEQYVTFCSMSLLYISTM